jgi:hypothetical protein
MFTGPYSRGADISPRCCAIACGCRGLTRVDGFAFHDRPPVGVKSIGALGYHRGPYGTGEYRALGAGSRSSVTSHALGIIGAACPAHSGFRDAPRRLLLAVV